jgi:PleD family two-component response regulator
VGGGSTLFKFSMMDEFEEGVLLTLFDLAQRDPLTGLYNRRYFDDRLRSEFLFAQRHDAPLGFLFIDIDHFKRVNDTRGHPMGDAVLRLVARSIEKMMRPEDVLCRYGGEEFTVLVRATSVRNLEILGARIGVRALEPRAGRDGEHRDLVHGHEQALRLCGPPARCR